MKPEGDRPQMQAGFVLHQRPYRDTSLIVDVFSRHFGRLVLVARGARRPRSSQRAMLQAFRPLLLSWRSSGEMGTLTGVEPDGAALSLSGECLLSAFYINELVLRLAGRQDPHPDLFDHYHAALMALTGENREIAVALRRFEQQALDCLGYGLPVDQVCLDGTPIHPEGRYRFDVQGGAYPIADHGSAEGDQSNGVSGSVLLALARDQWDDPAVLPEARRLLARALAPHLGGRPLKTARVLRDLRRRGLSNSNS